MPDVNGLLGRSHAAKLDVGNRRHMPPRAIDTPAATIDQDTLFRDLFSSRSLVDRFHERFSRSAAKGVDRLNGVQFAKRAAGDLAIASRKCIAGTYRFTPYCEHLRLKGRDAAPRVISVPTIRDRVVLAQLNRFLSALFPECRPPLASACVRGLTAAMPRPLPPDIYVCTTDIRKYYDSMRQDGLLRLLSGRVTCWQALKLTRRSIQTPTVPLHARRPKPDVSAPRVGVPQGLAISNLLASIYLRAVDAPMERRSHSYARYVDDILMLGREADVRAGLRSLTGRLRYRGLALHPEGDGKTRVAPASTGFSYLGYVFVSDRITVRSSTVERFLQALASKFSDYAHNKQRRLDRLKYLTPSLLADIFLMELNERISGAISENRRYGWIAYFNQITDLALLHRIDHMIARMFVRLPDFGGRAPEGLKTLSRSYFEMRHRPRAGYVRDYDRIRTIPEKIEFLRERGRMGPDEVLTEAEITERLERYVRRLLGQMQADENLIYR
jgi:RNA-directed DNA polymerase